MRSSFTKGRDKVARVHERYMSQAPSRVLHTFCLPCTRSAAHTMEHVHNGALLQSSGGSPAALAFLINSKTLLDGQLQNLPYTEDIMCDTSQPDNLACSIPTTCP